MEFSSDSELQQLEILKKWSFWAQTSAKKGHILS